MSENKAGAVIVFDDGVTKAEAQKILRALANDAQIEYYHVSVFDPKYGDPVFYIP